VLWLGVAAGVVCGLTGVTWVAVPDADQMGVFLLVLALLGGSALAAGAVWQRAAGPKSRVFVLVLMAALSGGYVLANTIGLVATSSAPDSITGLGLVQVASWIGAAVGGVLYILTLVEGLSALRARDRALNDTPEP
jgi:hypothetical protein